MVLCTRESREKGQNNGNHEPCQGFPYVVLTSRTHTNTLHSTQSSHRFAACASQTVYSYIESAKDTRRIVLSYVSFVWFWLCDLCARTEHLAIMYVHFVHTAVLSCTLPCAGIMTYFGPKWNVFSIYILHQQCMITVCFFCFSCGAAAAVAAAKQNDILWCVSVRLVAWDSVVFVVRCPKTAYMQTYIASECVTVQCTMPR